MFTKITPANRDDIVYALSKLSMYRNDDVLDSVSDYIYDRVVESKYIRNVNIDADPFVKLSAIIITKCIFSLGSYGDYLGPDISSFITLLLKEFDYNESKFYNKIYETMRLLNDSTNNLVLPSYLIYEIFNTVLDGFRNNDLDRSVTMVIDNIATVGGVYLEVTMSDVLVLLIKNNYKDEEYADDLLTLFKVNNYDLMEAFIEVVEDFLTVNKNELWLYKATSELIDYASGYLLINRDLMTYDECIVLGPMYKLENGIEVVDRFNVIFIKE